MLQVDGIQSIGGTGALRIGLDLLHSVLVMTLSMCLNQLGVSLNRIAVQKCLVVNGVEQLPAYS